MSELQKEINMNIHTHKKTYNKERILNTTNENNNIKKQKKQKKQKTTNKK